MPKLDASRAKPPAPRVLRRLRPGRADRGDASSDVPRVSVVVPVFNVEQYVAECLESLLAQTLTDLEVIVVDDGSTDRSREIVDRYAAEDPRIRVIGTDNRGLGAARNTGLAEARGEYLAFADSDDTVPPYAYGLMAAALRQTGSDFVVGSVLRRQGEQLTEPRWLRRFHARRRLGIVAEDFPEILGDVFAWNKLYRRRFLAEQRLAFPEGVRYEDQVMLTHAYLVASTFDVLRRPVYHWRIREDRSSITQSYQDLAELGERVRTKRAALATVASLGSAHLRDVFASRVLAGDMHRYFDQIPGCSPQYWDTLVAAVREFWGEHGSLADSGLPVLHRVVGRLVELDRRGDAEEVLRFAAEHPGRLPTAVVEGHLVATLPGWDRPAAQPEASTYQLRDHEMGWRAELTEVSLGSDSMLRIAGRARVGAAPPCPDATARVLLRSGQGHEVRAEAAPAESVRAVFSLADLAGPQSPGTTRLVGTESWTARLLWSGGGLSHQGGFTRLAGRPSVPVGSCRLSEELAAEVYVGARGGLRLTLRPAGHRTAEVAQE